MVEYFILFTNLQKLITNSSRKYDKNKELSYLMYYYVKNLYGQTMPQNVPLGGVEWLEDTPKSNKNFIKSCNEYSDSGCCFKVGV